MRPLLIVFCLVTGCRSAPQVVPTSQTGRQTAALFTDSSIYRAQCKEADTLPKLTTIPRKCTLRDQRAEIKVVR
jgi:hypothetical protein